MDIEMIAATVAFAALVIVWAFAPTKGEATGPVAAPVTSEAAA